MRYLLLLVTTVLFTLTSIASAAPLAENQIKNFISTLTPLKALSNSASSNYLGDIFKTNILRDGFDSGIYTQVLKTLRRADPKLLGKVEEIALGSGFSSTKEWAAVGDRVMAAFISMNIEKNSEQFEQALNAPNEAIANDPIMGQRLQQLKRLFQSAQQVPMSDKEAVRPFIKALESVGSKPPQ